MNSVMLIVLKTIAEQLPEGGAPPSFTVDHVISEVWARHREELTSAGFTPEDLRAIAIGAWNYAESSGWSHLRTLFREPVGRTVTFPAKGIDVARAGILDLPSGRWVWIAPEHEGFAHVSLQMVGRSTERMEGAVRDADFSAAEVDRIARDPSIRWWWDAVNQVIWEIRGVLRNLPTAARELTFSHATLGSRCVRLDEGLRLGELSDEALQALLRKASQTLDIPAGGKELSASA
jgi:hypothetical protein